MVLESGFVRLKGVFGRERFETNGTFILCQEVFHVMSFNMLPEIGLILRGIITFSTPHHSIRIFPGFRLYYFIHI